MHCIVELEAIICTGSKSVFWAESEVETLTVQRKAPSVRWKGTKMHWKASPGAVES
jgi:hypothetical protein